MSGYMDHWRDCAPAARTEPVKFRVGIRVIGGSGVIHIFVDARDWEEAHTKALEIFHNNARVASALSKGQY
jgi:hypothetical protein